MDVEIVVNLSSSRPESLAISPVQLTFTPENWNQLQPYTITSTDNGQVTGDKTAIITIEINKDVSDPTYADSVARTREVLLQDRDVPEILVSQSQFILTEGQQNASLTVRLSHQPESNVRISVDTSDFSSLRTFRTDLDFTPSNWNLVQTVTMFGVVDGVEDGDKDVQLSLAIEDSLSDALWDSTPDQIVDLTILDNNVLQITSVGTSTPTPTELYAHWTSVENAVEYDVELVRLGPASSVIEVTTSDQNQITVQTTLGLANYRIWVRAVYSDGSRSAWSNREFSVNPRPVVSAIEVDSQSNDLTVRWQPIIGATSYRLFARNITSNKVLIDQSFTDTSTTFSELHQAGKVNFWVQAINADGRRGAWSSARQLNTLPGPVALTEVSIDGNPTFQWSEVPLTGSYELYVAGPLNEPPIHLQNLQTTSLTLEERLPDGQYRWFVRATTPTGEGTEWSEPQNLLIGRRTALKPSRLETTSSVPTLEWYPVPGASSYDVYLQRSGHVAIRFDGLTQPSVQAPVLYAGSYQVWIRANLPEETGVWGWRRGLIADDNNTNILPTALTAPTVTLNQTPQLSWTASADPTATYDLILMNGHDNRLFTKLGDTVYTPAQPLTQGNWKWAVRAVNADGITGPWQFGKDIHTDGRSALEVIFAFGIDDPILLQWTTVVDPIRFQLQIDNLTTGESRVLRRNDLTEPSLTVTPSLAAGDYRAWVRAIASGNVFTPWSVPVDFRV